MQNKVLNQSVVETEHPIDLRGMGGCYGDLEGQGNFLEEVLAIKVFWKSFLPISDSTSARRPSLSLSFTALSPHPCSNSCTYDSLLSGLEHFEGKCVIFESHLSSCPLCLLRNDIN